MGRDFYGTRQGRTSTTEIPRPMKRGETQMALYRAIDNCITLNGCTVAMCNDAARAVELLNQARDLNDRQREYTAAARKIAEAESLPGFKWMEN